MVFMVLRRVSGKCCGTCRHWKRVRSKSADYGNCTGAIERARKVVSFAVNLAVSATFADGGKDCPCWEERRK